jgi:hypothetical protein
VVHEPCEVTHRLREIARQRLASASAEDLIAEKTFSSASNMLHAQDDLGLLRDRVRRYKEAIGARILHPTTLAAAVTYNVAMWNQVSDLIEVSRCIDHLADELLGIHGAEDAGEPEREPAAGTEAPGARALLASPAFARLEAAIRSRLGGAMVSDAAAERVAAACRFDGLLPAEAAAFSADAGDEAACLVRRAVVLGRVLREGPALGAPLRALGLDPDLLVGACASELRAEMTALARRLFAESSYDEAFRLSESKTRNLAALPAADDAARAGRAAMPRARGGAPGLDLGLPSGLAWVLLLLLGLPLLAALLWSSGPRVSMLSSSDLDRLSPFLRSGHRSVLGERTEFVGVLGPAWDYLEPRQRLRVTAEIGGALRERGVDDVVLVDRFERVQARYENGPVLEDAGRAALRPHAPLPPSASGLDLGR